MTYAVWYASAGCLPDDMENGPEYVGDSIEECEAYVALREYDAYCQACEDENLESHGMEMWIVHGRPEGPLGTTSHNLYSYSIEPYNEQEDDES